MRLLALKMALVVFVAGGAMCARACFAQEGYIGAGSTVFGSEATGLANVISAAGQASLMNSKAAINYEDARKKNFENRLLWTETYFEMRRMNKAYRDAERGSPMTREQAFRLARVGVPVRPKTSELDPLTGSINWPPQLADPKYAEYRAELERLFGDRAAGVRRVFSKIQAITDDWLAALKDDIESFKGTDYVLAKSFVENLAHESRFSVE